MERSSDTPRGLQNLEYDPHELDDMDAQLDNIHTQKKASSKANPEEIDHDENDEPNDKNYYQKTYNKRYRPGESVLADIAAARMPESIRAVEDMLKGLAHLQEAYRVQIEDLATVTGTLLSAYHASEDTNIKLATENDQLKAEVQRLSQKQASSAHQQDQRQIRDSSSTTSEETALGKRQIYKEQQDKKEGKPTHGTGLASGYKPPLKGSVFFEGRTEERWSPSAH